MSEPGTPPLAMKTDAEKSRRNAKRKKSNSSISNATSSNNIISGETKSRSRRRKRKISSSSSSLSSANSSSASSSSSPIRTKRPHKHKREKKRSRYAVKAGTNENTQAEESSVLKQLVTALDNRSRAPYGLGSQNVIPEFNPQAKNQTMKGWLLKINESAHIYGWSEQQIIFYALPRLIGLAKRWYDGLTSVKYSWDEWQEKLLRAFPCEENYADQLEEMLARKTKRSETYEEYYYDKIRLINRCEITGLKAVDCLTQGIYEHNVRMNAQGLSFKEPEDVLTYFRKISTKKEDFSKSSSGFRDRLTIAPVKRQQMFTDNAKNLTPGKCFNCGEAGHRYQSCLKDIIRCGNCKRVGHDATKCDKYVYTSNKPQAGSTLIPKNISRIESTSKLCEKYLKDVMVNEFQVKAFIDLGSECTLLSEKVTTNSISSYDCEDLPILKGFADGTLKPSAQANVRVQIDGITEEIIAYIVPHHMIPYGASILIGQNLTELPNTRIYKTDTELFLFKALDKRTEIITQETLDIEGVTAVPVFAREYQNKVSLFVSSEVCLKPGSEYIILPGLYSFEKGCSNIMIMSLTTTIVKLKKGQLIARGILLPEFMFNMQSKRDNLLSKEDCVKNIYRISEQGSKQITLADINTDDGLQDLVKKELCDLLNSNRECFAFSTAELGKTDLTEMHIKLKDDSPVTYRPYRLSISEREKVKTIIEDLCNNGIVRESESEYASPIILVSKKNGDSRLCVDYRALNKRTHKDKYPMPLIEDQIDRLCGQKFFTTLDLTSGYHQVPIAEGSKHLTAFITPDGHFEYNRMPFGLCNAPAVFQRLIHKVLNAKKIPGVLAYMDDIVVSSKDITEGMMKLRQVLQALKEANLTLNLSKCHFFKTCIEYLGYEISENGVKPGQRKTDAVASFKRPENVHEVRQFIGLASFFRRFVLGFATIARPLTTLTKSNEKWVWGQEQEHAFTKIKDILVSRPILAIYDPALLTELHTDASQTGIGGILMQRSDEKSPLRVVAYFSRQTTVEERHFHSFELETLAVVASLNRFRSYLVGIDFKIVTDCNAVRLTWTKRDLVPRIARWWLQAQEFNFIIEYRPGTQMSHVDALSRNPVDSPVTSNVTSLSACNVFKISVTPSFNEIQHTDPQLVLIKCILNNSCDEAKDIKNTYVLKDGKIYRKVDDALKWAVPQDARWKICHMCHDECGHMGIEKTLDKVKQTYWFPHMANFVKKYVRSCIPCAYAKQPTGKKEGFLHPIPKTPIPFHSVHVDHLGPFIKSKTGNTYILAIIDGYSKFIVLRAVRNTKSKTSISVLRDAFGIFGAPKLLISDRGTSFTSSEFAEFTREQEIKHIKNAVAMPRANGQIERYNRSILASLIALTHGEDDKDWDTHINTVQWSLNNTLNKGIGKTPTEVLFGKRTINLAEGHLYDLTENNTHVDDGLLNKIREEVSQTIEINQEKMEKRFNEKRRVAKEYKEGDLVLVQKQLNNQGESNKLLPRYSGPFRVTKVLGSDRYEVSSIEGHSKRKYRNIYAADKMKPWVSFSVPEEKIDCTIMEMSKDNLMEGDDSDME